MNAIEFGSACWFGGCTGPGPWVEADLENGMYSTSGGLTTTYSGALPNGYSPMHEEADILLGSGGDNSNGASGEFFEGAVTSGYPSDGTENAVQAELTTAGYA